MKKGQALVEFVIILPIFLMLVLGVVDLGNIFYTKITLESEMSDVITYYKDGKNEEEIKDKLSDDISLNIKTDNEYKEFLLIKKIDIITPGFNLIFGDPYKLKITRSIYE